MVDALPTHHTRANTNSINRQKSHISGNSFQSSIAKSLLHATLLYCSHPSTFLNLAYYKIAYMTHYLCSTTCSYHKSLRALPINNNHKSIPLHIDSLVHSMAPIVTLHRRRHGQHTYRIVVDVKAMGRLAWYISTERNP